MIRLEQFVLFLRNGNTSHGSSTFEGNTEYNQVNLMGAPQLPKIPIGAAKRPPMGILPNLGSLVADHREN